MNSDSTTRGTWIRTWTLALVAMLAIQVTLIVPILAPIIAPAIAHADDPGVATESAATLPDSLVYTFGFGSSTSTTCSNVDGADPKGSLTFANTFLFGRTSTTTAKGNGDGIVFHIDPAGSNYTIDHLFTGAKTDGNDPRHNAMTLDGTVLYGTTLTGGKHGTGTIFSIDDDGTGYSTPPLFDFDKSQQKNNGDMPHSCFALTNGVLYGMTSEGGSKGLPTGDGAIFSFDPGTATYSRLHSFDGKHGSDPHGQPILDPTGTTLYGMTRAGGKHNVGVIFSLGPGSCPALSVCFKLKTLHNFSCPQNATPSCIDSSDGATPDHGTLVQSGTTLFGLTTAGGKFGMGIIFSQELTGKKKFKVLHSFANGANDGQNPFGSLMLNGSTLYGTTRLGGNQNLGTVFQIDTSGNNYARVHDFQGGNSDGAHPIDDVILVNNTLYGMTEAGGKCNNGVIFAIALP
jgi:uncharacterized repeat protein (TIGR03803 family)